MIYSQDLIDEIKSSNDIVDIVSEYVKLKRAGKYYKGLCPFHKEKTPSFSVSPDKQIFYCFGCGMGGDAIRFISKIENIDFGESVEVLADRANIKLPENTVSGFIGIIFGILLYFIHLHCFGIYPNGLKPLKICL